MFSQHSRAMHAQRKPVLVGLVLLVCALTENFGECAPRGAAAMVPLRLAAIVRHMEGQRSTESTPTSRREPPVTPRDLGSLKSDRGDQIIEIFPRDLRKKEKFIKHLTGPLHFSPKCRKHVYRLYHNTRDCTVPAYFKRCARLLTRLAGSPRCTEG